MTETEDTLDGELWSDREVVKGLLQTNPVGIVIVDADGEVSFVNERAVEIHDRPPEGITKVPHDDSRFGLLDEDGDPFDAGDAPFDRVVEHGEAIYGQIVGFHRPGGERVWVSLNGAPQWDEQGELARAVFAFKDITDRRERQRELERFETLFKESTDVNAVLNPDGTFQYLPPSVRNVLGYEPEELIGEDTFDYVHPEDRERIATEFERMVEEPDYQPSNEFRYRHADGHWVWLETRGRNLLEDPAIEGLVVYTRDVTDRKRRERDLAKYETIVETINDGIYVLDDDGRFTMVNDAFVELTGYTRDELIGSAASLVVDDDTAERAIEVEQAMLEGQVDEPVIEADVVTADGERVPAEATFSIIPGDEYERVGVARDISERRERKRALEQNKEQFEALFEALPVGVIVADADGKLLEANDTAEEIWGGDVFDAESIADYEEYPLRWADSGEPIEREDLTMARVLDGERVTDPKEVEIQNLDGERRILDVRGVPVWDTAGDVVRSVLTLTEITERTEYKRRLEESERRYRTLAENFPNGAVGLFNEDLEYTVVGGELLDRLGVSPDDRIGRSIHEIHPPEFLSKIEPEFEAVFDGESTRFEVEYRGRYLHVTTLPIEDEHGEIFAGMTVVQDVTERREYERELKASNERLEQFAYAASHDLQEPLRMVSSYLQLIQHRYESALDEEGEEFLEFAVDGADRMREMIDALLEYSRVEARGDPFESVDLETVFDAALDNLHLQIEESDAEITRDELPTVEGDPNQLRQVFQNLLDNAIEYSGDEPPQIHVNAERDSDTWQISIEDDGIGIPPDDQDAVFQVFERLHSLDDHEGTGIGLALAERIVERHDGEIWVESEPGEGSTFTFAIPAANGDGSANQ